MSNASAEKVVKLINEANNISLDPSIIKFENPVDRADGRSDVTFSATSKYSGSAKVNYQRIGLNHLFSFFRPLIPVDESEGVLTPSQVIERIKSQFPIDLQENEVTITHEVLDVGTAYTVTAKENSLVYAASATFGTKPTVQTPITDYILPDTVSYVYPNNSLNKAYARIYSGGWYVTEAASELGAMLVGELANANLTWLTTILSGDDWYNDISRATGYNLGNAKVVYNGPVSGINLHPDDGLMLYRFPQAENVLLLELSDILCENLVGKLTYYY